MNIKTKMCRILSPLFMLTTYFIAYLFSLCSGTSDSAI